MMVEKITALRDRILISLTDIPEDTALTAVARVPLVHGDSTHNKYPGRILATVSGKGSTLIFPRYAEEDKGASLSRSEEHTSELQSR